MSIILKNNTISEKRYNDLGGMRIPASGEYTVASRTLEELQASEELKIDLVSGDITWNNGTSDLSIADAVKIAEYSVDCIRFRSIEDGTLYDLMMDKNGVPDIQPVE